MRFKIGGVTLASCVLMGLSSGQTGNMTCTLPAQLQPATKLEAFAGRTGRTLISDSYVLSSFGKTSRVALSVLVIYEATGTQKVKGLRVDVTESGSLERFHTSFIDYDELQGLSDALAYIIETTERWKGGSRESNSGVSYQTRGDFTVSFYQNDRQSGVFVKSGGISSASALLNTSDLTEMKKAVDRAIALLPSK